MAADHDDQKPVFRVIDALEAPHGGRILRLKLQEGRAPSVRELNGARMEATSPEGDRATVTVGGFAVFGGKPSDERLARTGRVDVHVTLEDSGDLPITTRWLVSPA